MKYEDFVDRVYELDLEKFQQTNIREAYIVKIQSYIKQIATITQLFKNQKVMDIDKEADRYKAFQRKILQRQQHIAEYREIIENYEEHIKEKIAKFILEQEEYERKILLFPYTTDETVKAVFTRILKYIQSKECDRDKLEWLQKFLDTINKTGILQYHNILKK